MSITQYDSRKNTMKRDPSSGVVNIAAPTTVAYVLNYVSPTVSISHNLGYVPAFRVSMEPFKDGVIWPPLSGRVDGNAQNPTNTSIQGPTVIAWVDSTNLYLQLFASSNTFTGTYPVYFVIYRDFRLSA